MQDFRNLRVWQKSHELVLRIYAVTKCYPKEELFGLTSQTRRSAMSIPSNIAEGTGRGSDPDFVRFLTIAFGSSCELDYQILLASDLGYVTEEEYKALHTQLDEVKRMLNGLIQSINNNR
jgi:four helix bundle protein